jgi:hypothetical protein
MEFAVRTIDPEIDAWVNSAFANQNGEWGIGSGELGVK